MQDAWASHRRHAIQIAAALPEEPEDALIVLELARHLVKEFLVGQGQVPERLLDRERGAVVSLSSATKGASL
jgi:hypothetical protein